MSVQVKGSGTIGGLDEGLVVSGIVTSSTQINVGSNIKLGSAGVVTATSFSGSGANLTSLPAQATIANNADNRVITGGSGVNLNGEANLTFDGSTLAVTGAITGSSVLTLTGELNLTGGSAATRYIDAFVGEAGTFALRGTNNADSSGHQVMMEMRRNAGVHLNYSGSTKLETTNTGAVVTGILTATSFRGDASQMTGAGLGTDGSANTSGIITATALVGDFAPRNMIINGAMQINQRGSGTLTVNSSSSQYPCDRWVSRGEGGSKTFTIEKTSIASSGQGIRNALKVTSSQAASVGSSDIFNVRQMIEGYNIQRLNLGEAGCASMALSFTAYSSVAGTHSGAIQNSAQNRSYPFTYTLVANTWTDVKITIPPITSGSFNEADGVGLRVVFDLGCGNNFRGTANQWNSAQDEGATGAVRILETNGATWYVTKVQLEEGAVATKYEKKLVGEEIRNCMRYYQRDLNRRAYWGSGNVSGRYFPVHFIIEMRATPSISFHSTSLDSGSASAHSASRQGYNFNMSGSGRFYEWAHVATAEI